MGLSAVYSGVYVCGMIDVSVKLHSKVKPKGSAGFQTHLYESCTKDTVSPQAGTCSSSSWNEIRDLDEEKT